MTSDGAHSRRHLHFLRLLKEIAFRQKAGSHLAALFRGGRDASELVNEILDKAEANCLITSKEADYVRT
ncbi:MAG: hypothetical protein ACK40X_02015, partial [Armatimonadota bacterium]